jgi:type IV pilus assembly protein PilF
MLWSSWWEWGSSLRVAAVKLLLAQTLLVLVAALGGCVSTSDQKGQPNPNAALQQHVQLGVTYLGEGNRQMARVHLLKALELDKNSAAAHNGMALLFQLEKEDKLADQHFRKAIASDKNFTAARNNYGVFLFKAQRYSDAYRQFEAASEDTAYQLRPQVFHSLGVCAERLEKPKEAQAAWLRAIELKPDFAMPYLELAEHYYNANDFNQASRYYRAFDQLSKPHPRGLWLAVRLANHSGDKDQQASKGLALEKLFPASKQNREYQEWLKNEAQH